MRRARLQPVDSKLEMNPYSPPAPAMAPYPVAPPPYAAAPGGPVTDLTMDMLRQTRPWVIFLSILCFLGCGFALLLSLGMFAIGAAMPAAMAGGKGPPFSGALLGLVYLPFAFLYIYPGIKLWSYGSAIGRLLASRSTGDLEDALRHQKSFWKFSGIAAIVTIALYVLLVVGLVVAGVAAGLSAAGSFDK